ncbi:hypothetical protein [Veronia pacifica]|uniref:Uncharacterized protein n=1 Tax=Veronia pacifica TaxID=1080227 RepID=A0A1C3ESN3_9GAMM|nr:hypothetical protein [Veronia pacifica]ODA36251.1 hypothetical protein A8L45_01230 [Veronia pacifica]
MENLFIYSKDELKYQAFEVSESEIKKAISYRETLVKSLDIEIIYDQIIESYWDYKNKVNYWNLKSLSFPKADYIYNHEVRSSLNRLAFNLFNLSKLYLDLHYNEDKGKCFSFELTKEQSSKQKVIDQRSEIYETNLNYVVGCKIRNNNQHGQLPVREFTTGIRYDKNTLSRTVNFNIFYYYEDLKKANVPTKRLSKDIKLELTDIIDGFVYAISQKHMLNRNLTEVVVSKARASLLSMWKSYANEVGFEKYRCEVLLQNNKILGLSLEWFDVFEHLKNKHSHSINYSNLTLEK